VCVFVTEIFSLSFYPIFEGVLIQGPVSLPSGEALPACWALSSVGRGQGRPESSPSQARSRAALASARSVHHDGQQAPNAPLWRVK